MSLTMTRPEKTEAMTKLVYGLREVMREVVIGEQMNIAEAVNGAAHFLASILVGAYHEKEREVVVSTFPDVVRAYYPEWERIYAADREAKEPPK